MKIMLLIGFLSISSICFAETIIDAAFSWNATTIYFIKGNTVVKYNNSANEVTKTMTLKQAFSGMPFSKIDAALDYGNDKVYFFSGGEYVRLDKNTNEIDANYPKKTPSQWEGLNFDQIDAAVSWSNGKTYFFRGKMYNRYDQKETAVDENYPKSITNTTWPGLNLSSVDASINLPNGKTYFFKDDQYYRFDVATDQVDPGYPKPIEKWNGVVQALQKSYSDNKNKISPDNTKKGMVFEHSSWAETLQKAKVSGKLIFVDAYATWCPPCKRMAANVFPDTEVGSIYNKNFINYKMDCEKGDGPSFLRKYQIEAYPTLLFIDGDGKVVKRVVGGQNTEEFIQLGNTITRNNANNKSNILPDNTKKGMVFEHSSWTETLQKAKASGKLIFVDAYATWCPPCKRMAANVFPDTEVGSIYNKNFINYKMDCEKGDGPSFLRKYQIEAYPTLLFIDGDGKVVKRVVGGQNTEEFIQLGNTVARSAKKRKGKSKQQLNGSGGN